MSGAKQQAEWSAERAGRRLGVVALVFGVAYLVWRFGWSWNGRSPGSVVWWLAVPSLAIEFVGFAGTALLMWALWREPGRAEEPAGHHELALYDIVIDVGAAPVVDLRATLVALRLERTHAPIFVVDRSSRSEVEDLAVEFGVRYLAADADDITGLAAARDASTAEALLMLEAGDIPSAGAGGSLFAVLAGPADVAGVQGIVVSTTGDSAEHAPNGRHDLSFERQSLEPGLGSRGATFLGPTGSLIRRSALSDVELPSGSKYDVLWSLTALWAAADLRVVSAPGSAVVAKKPLASATAVANDRSERRAAASRLVNGHRGALRVGRLRLRRRAALLAWAVRPMESVRRAAFAAVVLGSLLSGRTPFAANLAAIAGLWAPAFVLSSVALMLLSGGTLRPGDRLRGSLRSIRVSLPMLVAINSVLVVRGISDRFTHAMRPMDARAQVALVVVSLWMLAGCLDSLRLLARRRHSRRAARLLASTAGSIGDAPAHIADVTMLGAGLLTDRPIEIGARVPLVFDMAGDSGITSLEVPCVVRNARADVAGTWRIGVEFELRDGYTLDTLAECCVVLPSRAVLAEPGQRVPVLFEFEEESGEDHGTRRFALRAATLLALAAVISSASPLNADAAMSHVRTVSGVVVDAESAPDGSPGDTLVSDPSPSDASTEVVTAASTATTSLASEPASTEPSGTTPAAPVPPAPESGVAGVTIVGVCSTDPGADGAYGTGDDTYGSSVSTVTDVAGEYSLDLAGDACWLSIAPPVPAAVVASDPDPSHDIADPPPPIVVDLGDSNRVSMTPLLVERSSGVAVPTSSPSLGASISDRVWNDTNANAVQDPGEAGVSDATVTLYDARGHSLRTGATDGTGAFAFTALPAGTYSIGVTNLPAGLVVPDTDVIGNRRGLVALLDGQQLHEPGFGAVDAHRSSWLQSSPALPRPAATQLGDGEIGHRSDWAMLIVIAMASVLAASVLFASAGPIRGRRPTWR